MKVDAPVIHEDGLTDREISSVLFWSRVFPVSLPPPLSVALFKAFNSHFFISGPSSPSSGIHTAQFPCPPLCTSALTTIFSNLQPDVRNHAAVSASTSKHVGQELVSWTVQNEPQHCVQVPLIFFCHLPETRIGTHSPICTVLNLRNAGCVEGGSSLIRHSLACCRFLFSSIHKDTLAHLLLFIWFLHREVKAWSLLTHYFRAITIKPIDVTFILLLPT